MPLEWTRFDERIGRLIKTSFVVFLILGVSALVTATVLVIDLADRTRVTSASSIAASMAQTMSEIRSYYSSQVVPRVESIGGEASHTYLTNPNAVPLPATFSIELSQIMTEKGGGLAGGRLYSRYPFRSRQAQPLSTFEDDALSAFEGGERDSFHAIGEVGDQVVLRYAVPIVMEESCVTCHNTHPDSIKTDWKVGDIRGAQTIISALPSLVSQITPLEIFILAFLIIVVIGVACMVWHLLRLLRRTIGEKEALNVKQKSELRQAVNTTMAVSQSKSLFLATVGHEIRNSLNSVIGFATLLSSKDIKISANKQAEYITDIEVASKNLLDILDSVVDHSKLEAGKTQINEREFNLTEVIESVALACSRLALEKCVNLNLIVDHDVMFWGDAACMKQMINTVMENAFHASPYGGTVEFKLMVSDENRITLSIKDSGMGMTKAEIRNIFNAYMIEGVDMKASLADLRNGARLGMPIVKSLAELHEGKISVASKLGEGTLYTLEFPRERVLDIRDLTTSDEQTEVMPSLDQTANEEEMLAS